jgi:hypothetical protein
MVCRDAIKIADRPVYRDERRVTASTFRLDGRDVETTTVDVVRVWDWPAGAVRPGDRV